MIHSMLPLLKVLVLCCSCLALTLSSVRAQDNLFGNWYAWFNNVKFNEKWGLTNDIQFRAGKNWKENSMFLIRPGINYYVSKTQTASAGYATTVLTSSLDEGQPRLTEHRIWEQYIITGKIAKIPVQHRFRLEQRFLQRSNEDVFAQRARYFIRGIIPLNTSLKNPFTIGPFMAIQNELFFNIQNKDKLNGSVFDQNRAYFALGYRFSSKYDVELGYMNQFLKRITSPNQFTHIAQVAFYTRL